jgi:hypothetical protein
MQYKSHLDQRLVNGLIQENVSNHRVGGNAFLKLGQVVFVLDCARSSSSSSSSSSKFPPPMFFSARKERIDYRDLWVEAS